MSLKITIILSLSKCQRKPIIILDVNANNAPIKYRKTHQHANQNLKYNVKVKTKLKTTIIWNSSKTLNAQYTTKLRCDAHKTAPIACAKFS